MRKAIILARVSTKEQEATGLSLDKIQIPQMRQYAKYNDFEIVKEFVFQETANQKLRKRFDEMIAYIKAQKGIVAIIAYRVDRMTRNYRDAVEMDKLRIEHGKELHFVNDRLVLTENSYGRDIQDWDLKVFLAKQHINRCQEDTHTTITSKLKSGEQYGLAPFGYRNVRDEKGKTTVIVDDFEAGIVKKAFDLYTIGTHSYLSIAEKLNKEYPSLKLNKRKMEFIIKNPYYYGEREYKGAWYPHIYTQIITKEIFEMATDIRNGRTRSNKKGKLLGKTGLYRGLIYCNECGCAFSPSKNRHKKLGREVQSDCYYYCTNAKVKHKNKPKGTNDKEITKELAKKFKAMQIPKKDLEYLTNTLRESHEGKKEFTETEKKHCRRQIDMYQNRIEKAYEDKLDGSITTEQYDNLRTQWLKKKKEYEAKSERISKADEEYYITASYLLELASRSYELFMGSEPEQKRAIIALTLQNLKIKDGKVLTDWQKPFDSIFISAERHKWGD
ncbi:hypothetical protein COU74_03110 [Candidatus Peregrinibacteria bacterium CG10_big_fil_rev_8_21_14_0_10_36_19]|nr:MAG: hypothetical protein COU74_03110 [Candidatus Peregrinibacteria bacterium CG10_big_fil_rev_8_21_14_0_10_36_19]